jgi:hypothetical protein
MARSFVYLCAPLSPPAPLLPPPFLWRLDLEHGVAASCVAVRSARRVKTYYLRLVEDEQWCELGVNVFSE